VNATSEAPKPAQNVTALKQESDMLSLGLEVKKNETKEKKIDSSVA
jgi:hypothetical protein